MVTLYIFGDESGTMPREDKDKPFVVATVAFFEKTPNAICGSDKDDKLVEILRESNAIPFFAIVKPFPGYGSSLKSKYDKMLVMARAKRLLDGSTVPYIDKDGINLRNQVCGTTRCYKVFYTWSGALSIAAASTPFKSSSMKKQ